MVPMRLQLKRAAGFRLAQATTNPNGVVIVDRRTQWGNPFKIGGFYLWGDIDPNARFKFVYTEALPGHADARFTEIKTGEQCIQWFTRWLLFWRTPCDILTGKDLACWCHLCPAHVHGLPLGEDCADCAHCHADVWLLAANKGFAAVEDRYGKRNDFTV